MALFQAFERGTRSCPTCHYLSARRGLRARDRARVCPASGAEPDRRTQEALVDMVRENIRARQKRVDQVEGVAQDERAKLQQTADEVLAVPKRELSWARARACGGPRIRTTVNRQCVAPQAFAAQRARRRPAAAIA